MSFNQLGEQYELSQAEVAEKMFLHINTIGAVEKRAIEKFKKFLAERGITPQDLLGD